MGEATSFGTLDAPITTAAWGNVWGMRDGGEASHDGGYMWDGVFEFCSPAPATLYWVVDGGTQQLAVAAAAAAAARACLIFRVRWGESMMV